MNIYFLREFLGAAAKNNEVHEKKKKKNSVTKTSVIKLSFIFLPVTFENCSIPSGYNEPKDANNSRRSVSRRNGSLSGYIIFKHTHLEAIETK